MHADDMRYLIEACLRVYVLCAVCVLYAVCREAHALVL
jgi:hypothetical protein